jgi:hypothetical protein
VCWHSLYSCFWSIALGYRQSEHDFAFWPLACPASLGLKEPTVCSMVGGLKQARLSSPFGERDEDQSSCPKYQKINGRGASGVTG